MGRETKGCYGVDELCVGDELKGCVWMLVWGAGHDYKGGVIKRGE